MRRLDFSRRRTGRGYLSRGSSAPAVAAVTLVVAPVVAAVTPWGVVCIAQVHTHLSGDLPSMELAAIGRRVCETEWDLLELIG